MKDEIIRKQEELIEYSVSILRGLYPLLMIDSSKCIEKILIRLESNLAELKEQQPEQSAEEITEDEVKEEFEKLKQVVSDKHKKSLSAKEWLQNKYLYLKRHWNEHEHIDDNWVAQMMQEYRQQGMPTEEDLKALYDDLEKNAYNAEYHYYYVKEANQAIRRHFNKWKGE